jgi:hypothetical protein
MRVFSASFTAVLCLGAALAQVACSSDASTGTGSAGAAGTANSATGGSTSVAGSGGSSGSVSTGGDAGGCALESSACSDCLMNHCLSQAEACAGDTTCGGPLNDLDTCACDSGSTAAECQATFVKDGGSKASPLVACFAEFCMAACE